MGRFNLLRLSVLLVVVGTALAGTNSSRIVGGFIAKIGEFPFHVSLQSEDGSHLCGGSILNEIWVLTAAHCVVVGNGIDPYPPKYYQVRVGSIQRTAGGRLVKLKRVIVHQGYDKFHNDLSLLELEESLTFTDNIQPIELATEKGRIGTFMNVPGWGRLCTNCDIPYRLEWTNFNNFDVDRCSALIDDLKVSEDMLCLAHPAGYGICLGDTGGSASFDGKLYGVAGWMINGCASDLPDGYASIFYHRDWILEKMAS